MKSRKHLKEMTLEELWHLFPITLLPHNPVWKHWYEEEMRLLRELLGDRQSGIYHIGSTAIQGIKAKPIVDILIEWPDTKDWDSIIRKLEASGYILMSRSDNRMSFNKGYTQDGYAEKVFHIHFHLAGDNDELLFRDYLCEHPDCAKEYERLKDSLLPKYRNNRDGYTEAKSEFVRRIVSRAKLKNIDQ